MIFVVFAVTDSSENQMFPRQLSPEVMQALQGVRFIAQHIKDADKDNEVSVCWCPVSCISSGIAL